MAHFEYEYPDCWRQALILDVIRPYSGAAHFKYSGVLAGVNGSGCCAAPFSFSGCRPGRGGTWVRRGLGSEAAQTTRAWPGRSLLPGSCSPPVPGSRPPPDTCCRSETTSHGCGFFSGENRGNRYLRPWCHLLPAVPGRVQFRQAAAGTMCVPVQPAQNHILPAGYYGGSGGRNRAANRTAEAAADEEAPQRG